MAKWTPFRLVRSCLSVVRETWAVAALRRGEVEGVRNAQRWIALLFVSSAAGARDIALDRLTFVARKRIEHELREGERLEARGGAPPARRRKLS